MKCLSCSKSRQKKTQKASALTILSRFSVKAAADANILPPATAVSGAAAGSLAGADDGGPCGKAKTGKDSGGWSETDANGRFLPSS